MTEQADARLKALNASMKEALGKVTGSDELEAQGVREKSGLGAERTAKAKSKATEAPKSRPARRRS